MNILYRLFPAHRDQQPLLPVPGSRSHRGRAVQGAAIGLDVGADAIGEIDCSGGACVVVEEPPRGEITGEPVPADEDLKPLNNHK